MNMLLNELNVVHELISRDYVIAKGVQAFLQDQLVGAMAGYLAALLGVFVTIVPTIFDAINKYLLQGAIFVLVITLLFFSLHSIAVFDPFPWLGEQHVINHWHQQDDKYRDIWYWFLAILSVYSVLMVAMLIFLALGSTLSWYVTSLGFVVGYSLWYYQDGIDLKPDWQVAASVGWLVAYIIVFAVYNWRRQHHLTPSRFRR